MNELWIGVISGMVAGLITAAPNAWVAWWVNRRLDNKHGSEGAEVAEAHDPSGHSSHQTFVFIDQRIQQNIRMATTPDKPQGSGTEWVLGVGMVLLAVLLSQHQQVVTGALIGLSIGTAVATVLTIRRNRRHRGELGGKGILALCQAAVGTAVPLVAVLLLDALQFRGRTFWQYGSDSVSTVGPSTQRQDAVSVITSFVTDAVSSVITTVRDGGPQAVAFLLFAFAALVAAALAVASSSRILLAWNFYLGFVVADNSTFARRIASKFDRLSSRELLTNVLVTILFLGMTVVGSLWPDVETLSPALPTPVPSSP